MSEVIQINPVVLGGGGGVSTDWFTKLWENPTPTASFASQPITLASGVYDFLLIVFNINNASVSPSRSVIVRNDFNSVDINHTYYYGGTTNTRKRTITKLTSTSLSIGDADQNGTTNNAFCIPLAIYGIQKNGLAGDVSTLASNCMLSNGDSVEDVLGKGSVSVTGNGVKTRGQLFDAISLACDRSKITYNSFIEFGGASYRIMQTGATMYFTRTFNVANNMYIDSIVMQNSASTFKRMTLTTTGNTMNDSSSEVVTDGQIYTLHY